jgi:hypothetical protein
MANPFSSTIGALTLLCLPSLVGDEARKPGHAEPAGLSERSPEILLAQAGGTVPDTPGLPGPGVLAARMRAAAAGGRSLYVDAVRGNDQTAESDQLARPYANLEAAFLSARTNDTIYIGPGIYQATNRLILRSGMRVIGSGVAQTVVRKAGLADRQGVVIVFDGDLRSGSANLGCYIGHLTIDANAPNLPLRDEHTMCGAIVTGDHATIEHVRLLNLRGSLTGALEGFGLVANGGTNLLIRSCSVEDYRGGYVSLIHMGGSGPVRRGSGVVRDNSINGGYVHGHVANGIGIAGARGSWVVNNRIVGVKNGVYADTGDLRDLVIEGNSITISNSVFGGVGVYLVTSVEAQQFDGIRVAHNAIRTFGRDALGIQILHSSTTLGRAIRLQGNTIFKEDANLRAGIRIRQLERAIIDSNVITGADTGVWLLEGTEDTRVFDNVFLMTAVAVTNAGTGTVLHRTPAAVLSVADAPTIETDARLAHHFRVTLGGNRLLANPTGGYDGQRVTWEIVQDRTGRRTLRFDSKFVFGVDLPTVTLSTTAGRRDFLTAVYDATADRWFVIDLKRGY